MTRSPSFRYAPCRQPNVWYAIRSWQRVKKVCPCCNGFGRLDERTLCEMCGGEGTVIEDSSGARVEPTPVGNG